MDILKIKKVPIRIHYTFFIMVLVFAASQYEKLGFYGALSVIYLFLILAVSVILHELGHVLAAKKFGIDTASVTLYPFGGIAALKGDPVESGHEIFIAFAGPAVNFLLVILGCFMIKLNIIGAFEFTILNLAMGVFNLFPAYPMDGGRILRSLLSKKLGIIRATRASMLVSCVFAVLFLIIGILSGSITLPIVSFALMLLIYSENKRLNKKIGA